MLLPDVVIVNILFSSKDHVPESPEEVRQVPSLLNVIVVVGSESIAQVPTSRPPSVSEQLTKSRSEIMKKDMTAFFIITSSYK